MTRNMEDRQWDSDRGFEDDDDLLSLGSDTPLADVGYGDEIDSFDEVDTIADELSLMGFHSASDLG